MVRTTLSLMTLAAVAGLNVFSLPTVFAAESPEPRSSMIARAQVWLPTDIPAMDIKAGPTGPGAVPWRATVHCDYLDKKLSGQSPKFACRPTPDDEVKVKYGGNNGEVYGEVAASRLLWALGFGADHMYPVRVVCRGCPTTLNGMARSNGERVFDPAVIERKMPAREIEIKGRVGWSWKELSEIDEAGGASRAHRDALKLLAVFLQHTDTKPQQQRLVCLDDPPEEAAVETCARPFLMLNDVGVTFGRASTFNGNTKSSVNLSKWAATPVWKDAKGCVGDLPKSFTGTLDDPVISEEGRRFLADLMMQLSDVQIRDFFEVAQFELRLRNPGKALSGFPSIDEWVDTFKLKRSQIVDHRCS